ncbi:MAG: hypothetical protein GX302_01430 [Methanosarcina flavescens]|jgi:hypothetical protein|uniref:Uncharacterized protein n=3 Tax=Methanosarcina TaxID=2207 RepID=A0A7K4AS43_9EURY|nr:hypothetical protein [Methanosarcina flavescens]NLK31529.1 hypothetical protein [Methanosarcina flavescens]
MMQQPVKGDKTYTMFNSLVAAKLNVKSGCRAPCEINNIITGADRWMKAYKLGSGVKGSSEAWKKEFEYCGCKYPSGEEMHKKLDAFNNGYYC